MDIGILTFHRAVNYGAVFQTYALQKTLLNMGFNTYVVDYRSNQIEKVYIPQINWKHPKQIAFDVLMYRMRVSKLAAFNSFLDRYIQMLPFEKIIQCEALITGSDQVWNFEITGNDLVYFLETDNTTAKRISYAACTGKNSLVGLEKKIKETISSFTSVSVRDRESVEVISKYYDGSIEMVPDPTLLLVKDEWNVVAKMTTYKSYIVVFAVGFSERLSDFAHSLSENINCMIVFLNSNFRKKGRCIYLDCASPDEAIGLLLGARYVVTNSFHGTAMSVALEKEFFVEIDHDKKGRNHRVESLLNDVNITGREITTSSYIMGKFNSIDWEDVCVKKARIRKIGIDFLKNSLN